MVFDIATMAVFRFGSMLDQHKLANPAVSAITVARPLFSR